MSSHYDVVVVGARAAGASTAMLLARLGHSVLVVDRATMPSDTVSTHALLRTGVLQLERWGLLDRIVDAGTPALRSLTLGFGADRVHTSIRPEHGVDALFAPRRIVLDRVLLDAATEAGADFAGATAVTDLIVDDGRVAGVVAVRDGVARHIRAQMVIGADGVRSRVARLAGAPLVAHHEPTNAIHYAYVADLTDRRLWFQFTPGVNAGCIPTNDGLTCVFVARPQSRLAAWRRDHEREFATLLAAAGEDLVDWVGAGRRVSGFRGTTGLPDIVRRAWGPGWALVGDAGYTIDPISAHGISNALRDAELCARAVHLGLETPPCGEAAMAEFEHERDRLSAPILRESRALAAYGWDAAEASTRMRRISGAVRAECDFVCALPARHGALVVAS